MTKQTYTVRAVVIIRHETVLDVHDCDNASQAQARVMEEIGGLDWYNLKSHTETRLHADAHIVFGENKL